MINIKARRSQPVRPPRNYKPRFKTPALMLGTSLIVAAVGLSINHDHTQNARGK